MTVEEALAIVETALDYDRLNHVQEILFRQSWAGLSYREIAKKRIRSRLSQRCWI